MHEIRSSILSGEGKPSLVTRKKAGSGSAASLGLTKIKVKREETRTTNQRGEDRVRDLVQSSTVVFRRRKHEVSVINVSSRGAMIESDIDPRIGEAIEVQFSEQNRTRCLVRWMREGRIGLEFVDETIIWDCSKPHRQAPDRRAVPGTPDDRTDEERAKAEREERQKLIRKGTLYWSGITIPVRIRNISEGGANVEGGRTLWPGAEVELDLGDAGWQMAEVRWAEDGQLGLRFFEPFDLDTLAPARTDTEAPAEMLKPAYLETETRSDSPWASRFQRLSMTELKMIDPEH
ncbi:MAG: PilZ protein [Alphaproteobacteria bacterium]|nr:PilZ protein [Alphaproteobacteria bacterium]MDB5719774.1 PilZ protein [Alphaproteobacteria bacterium]